ncbi:MAG TPA: hypothetical protein PLE43_04275 [Alphaproteobacteria bacterium]|jgi:hypothetical protein|nr:hypothetical protein [Alphaproteobacteria bacterium]MCB9985691.1 hypothetical protein [Micavibrio sp.]HRK97678.1 hypothetical protein [Alphaproteobacteria bacterium]
MALDLDGELDVLGVSRNPVLDMKYVIPENAPVLPSIVSGGRDAELLVDIDSNAAVLYNQPLPEEIEWVEYDMDLALLTFVTYSGKVQGLGMTIHKPFRKYLGKADKVMMIYMEDAKFPRDIYPAKLIVRYTGI